MGNEYDDSFKSKGFNKITSIQYNLPKEGKEGNKKEPNDNQKGKEPNPNKKKNL
jgi:hypothetical protein